MADVTYRPVCVFETTFPHDHRSDNSGIDDGPPLKTRKKAAPKSLEVMAMIRARAWATRRVKYGKRGNNGSYLRG